MNITSSLVRILPEYILDELSILKEVVFKGYAKQSYSEDGIDLILKHLIGNKKIFYIDIGANHPFRHSNTYLFYKTGSEGINIDATPGSMRIFNKTRSRDLNLEVAISNKRKYLNFYLFKMSPFNGFDEKLSMKRSKIHDIKGSKIIKTIRLSEILNNLSHDKAIDLLSIDTEGHDLNVLKSNDWRKYRPTYIIVEEGDSEDVYNHGVNVFLKSKGYKKVAFTGINSLYKR